VSNLELKLELISFTTRSLTNYDKPTLPHEANSLDVDDNVLIQINTILDIYNILFVSFYLLPPSSLLNLDNHNIYANELIAVVYCYYSTS
jgi:hypothetical protein